MKNNDNASERGGFGSRIGFILAAAGSAVGLGNTHYYRIKIGSVQ